MLLWCQRGMLAILALALAGIWVVSVSVNALHALQMMGASAWAYPIAVASGCADVMKVAAGLSFVAACRQRAWLSILAAALVWSSTTFWSVKSTVSYAGTLIIETRSVRGEQLKTAKDNLTSIREERDSAIEQLKWLRSTITHPVRGANKEERDNIRDERAKAMDEARALEVRVDELRRKLETESGVVVAGGGVADPLAMFFSGFLSQSAIDIASAIIFLGLIEIGSSFGLLAFAPLYGRRDEVPPEEPQEALPSPDGAEPVLIEEAPQAPAQAPREGNLRDQARSYILHLLDAHGRGARLSVSSVQRDWPAWARKQGIKYPMASNTLGQQMSCLGVGKIGRQTYVLPKSEPAQGG